MCVVKDFKYFGHWKSRLDVGGMDIKIAEILSKKLAETAETKRFTLHPKLKMFMITYATRRNWPLRGHSCSLRLPIEHISGLGQGQGPSG